MMNIKQVYATLKIDDGQIQILVAEYFNTRFNVINTYSSQIDGIVDYRIVDEEKVLEGLKKAIDTVSNKIGARLEKVILVLPPFGFKRTSLRVSIIPSIGYLTKKDVARAITNSLKTKVEDNLTVINTHIAKYTVNGISSRRLPENEACEEAILDIDLLCADKEMAFSYVELLTKANLEILDLCLSNYAIAKESVSLENSVGQNIVLLDIGENYSYMSLLSKAKLLSTEIIYDGLNKMVDMVYKKYHLPITSIARLIKYNVDFDSNYPSDAIYAWNDEDSSKSITTKELTDFLSPELDAYVDRIVLMCKPIIQKGASFLISGEGSEMKALLTKLKEKTNCDVKAYYPDAIGVRNSSLCAVYGALFVYKEKANLNGISVNAVEMMEYDKTVNQIEVDVEGESITSKIKKLFETYKDREDI